MSAPAPTLVYVIEDRGKGARVEWLEEPVAITIEEALRPKAAQALNGRQAAERLDCDAWLHAFLAGGVKPAAEVMNAGTAAGFSRDQLRRPSTESARSPGEKALAWTVDGFGNLAPTQSPADGIQR